MYYLYGALFFLGLTFLGFSIRQYQLTKTLLDNGVKTKAVVINLIESTDDDGDILYTPLFEYSDTLKQKHVFKSSVASRPSPYSIGQRVSVIYDPLDFENVKTVSFWGLYRWSTVLLCVAAPLLVIGGGYLMYDQGIL